MTWQLFAAAGVGGFAGAVLRDVLRAVARSDLLWYLSIRSDVRAIAKAVEKAKRRP